MMEVDVRWFRHLACLPVLIAGCSDEGAPRGGGAFFGGPPPLVVAESATLRSVADVVEAIGTTRANESVTITAKVTDSIRHVRFEDGDFVNRGDILVELTNEEQTALLKEAEANQRDAETQYNRLADLLEAQSVPASDVDEAEARLVGARARFDAIVARIDDRLIRAPFKGLLGFRQVSAGTLITPGTPITTLDDVSVIKLDFPLPEVHLGVVHAGLELTAESAAFPGTTFTAAVRTVGSRVDPVTRAVPVRAHIDNPDALLRPGMLMTVRLTTASRRALMVPETALVQRATDTFVYVLENEAGESTAKMTPIDLGLRRDGWAEARSGLSAGQQVIVDGLIKVSDGGPVRVAGATGDSRDRGEPGVLGAGG
ncbi:MAG: efflux RND transporter periplasmic adaptor subunit [Gammaproteobacteria bacterium]|nr:efflux RND transporter periplasmic adaptor subunit [Gammaproteobacteria bacterium]